MASQVALGEKNLPASAGYVREGIQSLGRENLQRRKWQPIPVFLPGKSHGQRSLMGYSPWRRKRVSDNLATKQQQFSFKSSNY